MGQERPDLVSVYQQPDQAALSLQSRFSFTCHEGLACFNRCCRTPTIMLSPYDIYRLKQFLKMTSREFLERYTLSEAEERSNLPLVFLNPFRPEAEGCPFLGDTGCRVYSQRPAACRLFPITMGSQLTEQGVVDYYFCRKLDYCQGFDTEVQWTVASWQANQGFVEYDQGRRAWLKLILKQGLRGPVDARMQDVFASVSYDLDSFRQRLSEPALQNLPQGLALDANALELLQKSDPALLEFGYRYLDSILFGDE